MPEHDLEVDDLFSLAYEELRRLAVSVRGSDPAATLRPTGLVHEAWLKLARSPGFSVESRLHFRRVAGRAMRQVLLDAARRRSAARRGGVAPLVTFDEALDGAPDRATSTAEEVIALDGALAELAEIAPRQASVVESRFYAGLEVREVAEVLGVSESTVMRDWRAARAWLASRLRSGERDRAGER